MLPQDPLGNEYNSGNNEYVNNHKSKLSNYCQASKIIGDLFTGIIIASFSFIIKFIYQLIFAATSSLVSSAGLMSSTPIQSHFLTFYYPIMEELLKLGLVLYHGTKASHQLTPFDICLIWAGYTLPSLRVYLYSPENYVQHYAKFLQYYNLWLNQDAYRNRYSVDNDQEVTELWKTMLVEGKVEPNALASAGSGKNKSLRHSTSSEDSGNTIISKIASRKLSYKVLPSEFKTTRQTEFSTLSQTDESVRSSVAVIPPCPVDIVPPSAARRLSFTEDGGVKNYKSCSDLIHRLYSVSPKDTYHLNTAVAIATFEDFDENPPPKSMEGTHFPDLKLAGLARDHILPEVEEVYENIDELPTDVESLNGHSSDNDETEPQSQQQSQNKCNRVHYTKKQILINLINRLAWLLPPFLPIKSDINGAGVTSSSSSSFSSSSSSSSSFSTPFPPDTAIQVNERYPLLKSSLSHYRLGQEQHADLENGTHLMHNVQTFPTHTSGSHRVFHFQAFMSYYYDLSLSLVTLGFSPDAWFMRYGQLIVDASWGWVLLDELNYLVWQLLTFIILGFYVLKCPNDLNTGMMPISSCIGVLLSVIVPKLFKLNFLHNCMYEFDIRLVMICELLVNLGIIIIILICLFLF